MISTRTLWGSSLVFGLMWLAWLAALLRALPVLKAIFG